MVRYEVNGDGVLNLAVASARPLAAKGGRVAEIVFDAPSRRTGTGIARVLSAAIDEIPVRSDD
jgi:hypothetical protein